MKLKPLHDWAVIRPSAAEERTAGGLYIPDTAKEKPEQGVVEAIGPGALEPVKYGKKKQEQKERKFIPTTIKSGDHVLFERYAGQTYKIGTEEMVLVRERDILGVLPEGPVRPRITESPRQIPAATSSPAQTGLAKTTTTAIAKSPQPKKAAAPSVVKAVKKAAPKSAAKAPKASPKKAAKKTAPKPAAGKSKKAAAKKTGKKK